MAPGGLAVWLIPSEFMDVNYGSAVKAYLTEKVKLDHIHRYCPSDVQFCDALVTSAIVVFEKSPPPPDHHVRLSFGGPITDPATSETVALAALRRARKWTGLAGGSTSDSEPSHTLGDFFAIKRGMATGANAFFILDRQEALRKGIPAELPSPDPSQLQILAKCRDRVRVGRLPAAREVAGGHRLRPTRVRRSGAVSRILGIP